MFDFKKAYKNFKHKFTKEYCYNEMVGRGAANNGKCGGLTGGDRFTDYLNYACVSCPYLEIGYGTRYGKRDVAFCSNTNCCVYSCEKNIKNILKGDWYHCEDFEGTGDCLLRVMGE